MASEGENYMIDVLVSPEIVCTTLVNREMGIWNEKLTLPENNQITSHLFWRYDWGPFGKSTAITHERQATKIRMGQELQHSILTTI